VRQRQLLVPRGNPWLFPGDTPGQPVKEIRRFWIGIQKEAKLPDVRIHDLRHTFASLLVSGGASLEMIGKLLGHSQMQTTQRYAHLMDSPLRAGVNAVASIFRPRPQLVHDADQDPATICGPRITGGIAVTISNRPTEAQPAMSARLQSHRAAASCNVKWTRGGSAMPQLPFFDDLKTGHRTALRMEAACSLVVGEVSGQPSGDTATGSSRGKIRRSSRMILAIPAPPLLSAMPSDSPFGWNAEQTKNTIELRS
jgi:hypothetical protein